MNCQDFEILVNDLARQQRIEASLRQEALAHGGACERCGARLANERMLTSALGALATGMKSEEAPERVKANLLAAFRNRQPSPELSPSNRWGYFAAVAAAVVLIVVGISVARLRQTPSQNVAQNVAEAVTPVEAKVPHESLPVTDEPAPAVSPVKEIKRPDSAAMRRTKAHQTKARPDASPNPGDIAGLQQGEVASAFVPLGYMSPVSFQDGGQIVRVELTRAAMANLGFAVNMDRYNERVKADVLVGNDGLARAIRIVQ
ncbi:MAG: hypothetical protein ABJB97_01390 [Acidobacteriota bacterium]